MLSGAAGHTYGAAGVWHMSVEGDPGITPIYDWTTWKEGMNYPGSTQLGLGKRLLEQYPWVAFRSRIRNGSRQAVLPRAFRAKCVSSTCLGVAFTTGAAPWSSSLERDVPYHAFYFNPTNAKALRSGDSRQCRPGSQAL